MPYESLSQESVDELQFFADHANWQGLHPLDWQRFFDFIRGTFAREEHALPSDIAAFLVEAGGAENTANRVAHFYEPARALVKYLDEQTA